MKRIGIYIATVVCILSCIPPQRNLLTEARQTLVGSGATERTVALFYNLHQLTGKRVVCRQHNYEMDGFDSDTTRRRDEANRRDAYDVTGAYPALASFDFFHFTNSHSWEIKDPGYIRQKLHIAYNRGNAIIFRRHYYSPVIGGNFYDATRVVRHILPGDSHHAIFKAGLKTIADFVHNAKVDNGELIPIMFRPWHKSDGNWFWWGRSHCRVKESKELYRFTVTYLRDSLQTHNFLYAFSPDCGFTIEAEYLGCYPGDECVDVVGMNNYWDFRPDGGDASLVVLKARTLTQYARQHVKLSITTEAGAQTRDPLWYTQLLSILCSEGVALNYVYSWSGSAPYKGHPAVIDFCRFKEDSLVLSADEIPDFYTWPQPAHNNITEC